MLLLNFSHPITDAQQAQIEALTGAVVERVLAVMPQFDEQQPFAPQLDALLAQIDLTPAQWQSEPILVVLPSLNFIAAGLLAELHGRMGYFPQVVRTRPVAGVIPRRYEAAEILDLQGIRDDARRTRCEKGR
ncbi:MAG: CRISPR-associated protein Csx15 [Caldilineaceae bacterium]